MNGNLSAALVVLAAGTAACAHVPRLAPSARSEADRARTAVRIEVSCDGEVDGADHVGSGVIISGRHVLTAAHVVSCSVIPDVHVTYRDGGSSHRVRMVVTREDRSRDIARLEIASAERFRIAAAPPVLRAPDPGDEVCAEMAGEPGSLSVCGSIASDWTVARTMHTAHGDSGAPVFDNNGILVGLVVSSGTSTEERAYTRLSPVDDSWTSDLVPDAPAVPSPWRLKRPPLTASR